MRWGPNRIEGFERPKARYSGWRHPSLSLSIVRIGFQLGVWGITLSIQDGLAGRRHKEMKWLPATLAVLLMILCACRDAAAPATTSQSPCCL